MIRYLDHTITEHTHIETGEKLYALNHWYVSDEAPQVGGSRNNGYFKSRKEAENRHNELLVKGLIQNEGNGT